MPAKGRYLEQLGFARDPFPVVPDARDYFLTPDIEVLVVETLFAINERKGFVVISGEVGLGKSTFSRYLLRQFQEKNISFALILNSFLQEESLIDEILRDFALPESAGSLQQKLDTLNQFLLAENSVGKNCVLVVDDAQNLSLKSLEVLRLLSNLETESSKLLQILLIGQPELAATLNMHELRQLKSRIVLFRELQALDKIQLKNYIDYKLGQSEGVEYRVAARAYRKIYAHSRGNLRQTNLLLDRILLSTIGYSPAVISAALVDKARADIAPPKLAALRVKLFIPLLLLLVVALLVLWFMQQRGQSLPVPLAIASVNTASPGSLASSAAQASKAVQPKAAMPLVAPAVNFDSNYQLLLNFLQRHDLSGAAPQLDKLLRSRVEGLNDFSYGGFEFSAIAKAIKSPGAMTYFELSDYGFSHTVLVLWRPLEDFPRLDYRAFSWAEYSMDTLFVQRLLAKNGYFIDRQDGVVGPKTMEALIAFQQAVGLSNLGKLDAPTRMALHHPEMFLHYRE